MSYKSALLAWKQTAVSGRIDKILQDIIDAIVTPQSFTDVVKPKVWRGHLSQASTSAPTAVVLENGLSAAIVWTRTSSGIYVGTLVAAFVSAKTYIKIGAYGTKAVTGGQGFKIKVVRTDADTITITTGDTAGTGVADDVLGATPLEIRVYQ